MEEKERGGYPMNGVLAELHGLSEGTQPAVQTGREDSASGEGGGAGCIGHFLDPNPGMWPRPPRGVFCLAVLHVSQPHQLTAWTQRQQE